MKRVLIIGASGSLGSAIAEGLKSEFEITGTYRNNKISSQEINYTYLDITDPLGFDTVGSDYDSVVLVAGLMPAEMEGYNPQAYIDVNITGALNVLEYCRANKIKKIIYIMTFSDVSGSFYTGIPIEDLGERVLKYTGDHSVYSISKVAATELIEHYHQEYGIQTIVFRIPTVYCNDSNYDYFVDGKKRKKAYVSMIQSIVKDKKIELWGDVSNSKDMPYIKDFVNLIALALDSHTAQGIYNAGTGNPISLEFLVNTMIEVFSPNDHVEKTYLPDKPSQPNFTFSMERTFSEFGYKPKYKVKDMLTEIKDAMFGTNDV